MLSLAVAQRAQYLDNDGNPLSGGRVTYYDVGTTIPKAVFADPNSVIDLGYQIILDAGGFVPPSGVFYGEGNYTILVEKLVNPESPTPIWVEEYTIPDVPGTIISQGTSSVLFTTAVENIPNLNAGEFEFIYCQQYYNSTAVDSGGGWFKWYPSSTATPDLGSIFATTGSPAIGRYIRIYPDSIVKTSYYGVVANKGTNMSSRIQSANTYAFSNRMSLSFTPGDIQVNGDTVITSGKVFIQDGFRIVRLNSLFAATLTINCSDIEVLSRDKFIAEAGETVGPSNIIINSSTPFNVRPEWWGGDNSGTFDSWSALSNAAISANNSNSPLIIDGMYVLNAVGSGSQPSQLFSDLLFTQGSYIETTYPKIIIGNVDKYPSDTYVIRSPDSTTDQYLASSSGSVSASWVFPTTMTNTFYNRVISDLEDVKTKVIHVYWDSPRGQGWTVNGALTDDDVAQLSYHYFSNGNYLRLDGVTTDIASFGRIRTLNDCLDVSFAAPKSFAGDVFNMQWWGLDLTTSGTIVAGVLNKSIRAATYYNGDVLSGKGTLDLNQLTLESAYAGEISIPNGNIKIMNGSLFGTGRIAKIIDADYVELSNITGAIDINDCIIFKADKCVMDFFTASPTFTAEEVVITNTTINTLNDFNINSISKLKVIDNDFTLQNKLFVSMCPSASFNDNNITLSQTKLTEYYRHIEFKNISQSSITNNKFKAGQAIGSSVPSQNLAFIWLTGVNSSAKVVGFSMFGNQMIDNTNPKASVPAYAYDWLVPMAWITQADLAVDGHIADVYDNYGNIYTTVDANGNQMNAQLIPGTRCNLPRIYSGIGNETTFYFILPRKIQGLGGDPNFSYPSVFKFSSGPNITWGGADLKPATVQPPTTATPPFSAKVRNDNLVYQINAEVWVNSGMGNQIYVP